MQKIHDILKELLNHFFNQGGFARAQEAAVNINFCHK